MLRNPNGQASKWSERKAFLSEMGVEWATGTKPLRAAGYGEFRLFK